MTPVCFWLASWSQPVSSTGLKGLHVRQHSDVHEAEHPAAAANCKYNHFDQSEVAHPLHAALSIAVQKKMSSWPFLECNHCEGLQLPGNYYQVLLAKFVPPTHLRGSHKLQQLSGTVC